MEIAYFCPQSFMTDLRDPTHCLPCPGANRRWQGSMACWAKMTFTCQKKQLLMGLRLVATRLLDLLIAVGCFAIAGISFGNHSGKIGTHPDFFRFSRRDPE